MGKIISSHENHLSLLASLNLLLLISLPNVQSLRTQKVQLSASETIKMEAG